MTSSQANMEISDVLSSIRRLVSEDRRSLPAMPPLADEGLGQTPADADKAAQSGQGPLAKDQPENAGAAVEHRPVSRMPTENRFVLTAALRVEGRDGDDLPAGDADIGAGAADPESGTAEVARDLSQEWDADRAADEVTEMTGETGQDETNTDDGASVVTEPNEAQGEPSIMAELQPLGAGAASTVASLEATIAELEAAVAGIQAEFEPDHGDAHDVEADQDEAGVWPSREAVVRPMSEFRGILAGFDAMAHGEERLDMSVTGEVLPPTSRAPAPSEQGGESGDNIKAPVFATFSASSLWAKPEAASDVSASGQPDAPQPEIADVFAGANDDAGVTRHGETFDPETDAPGADEVAISASEIGSEADFAGESDVEDHLPAFDVAAESFAGTSTAPEEIATQFAEPMADATDEVSAQPVDDVTHAQQAHARPEIIRPDPVSYGVELELGQEAPLVAQDGPEPASVESRAFGEDDLEAAEDNTGALDDDALGEAEEDLFDPLAGSDLDMDMLRDMVAEIIRDELRSTLGERITRNLRALVRREIERALQAEGFKRG